MQHQRVGAQEGAGRGRAGRQEGGSDVDAVRDEQLGGEERAAGGAEVRAGQLRASGVVSAGANGGGDVEVAYEEVREGERVGQLRHGGGGGVGGLPGGAGARRPLIWEAGGTARELGRG